MEFSSEETKKIIISINAALRSEKLDGWQLNFLKEMEARFSKCGRNTRLSEKQRAKLFEILVLNDGIAQNRNGSKSAKILPFVAVSKKKTKTPAKRSRRGFFYDRVARRIAIVTMLFATLVVISNFTDGSRSMPSFIFHDTVSSGQRFKVTDGDTVKVIGESKGTRLVGFNTPETLEPQCERELEIGRRATARLKELVLNGVTKLRKVPCACAPGSEGTQRCNYGRSCGVLTVDNQDVGRILISEGLAVPFICGKTSCPRSPRPWCGR